MRLKILGIAVLLVLLLSSTFAYSTNYFCYPNETSSNEYVWITGKTFYAPQNSWLRNYADDLASIKALNYYKNYVWVR